MRSYNFMAIFCFLLTASGEEAPVRAAQRQQPFVHAKGNHLEVDGGLYAFVGANFWYGANLGASDGTGDRPRLQRELDRLEKMGISNLRVMASSEGPDSEPWRMAPAMQPEQGVYNSAVLEGLDYLLDEMGKRHMRAVMCLGNFWHWSGGMAQYLQWNGEGAIPYPPPADQGDWGRYTAYTSRFYTHAAAQAGMAAHIRFIVSRTNTITGVRYADDPTIMTWELANEPSEPGDLAPFLAWIEQTSHLIKSLDSNHLVISGSEGRSLALVARMADIDYATIHMWVQNNGWYDPLRPGETYESALGRAESIIENYRKIMTDINKPLVLAEFGLARDLGRFEPATPTLYRDHFYERLLGKVYEAARRGEGLSGINFWAWAGEGRQRVAGGFWQPGDQFIGDPPHEQQGWYSVYDTDDSTITLLQGYAGKMSLLH